MLDEFVAIGYGVQQKKLITGATVQVKGDDIAIVCNNYFCFCTVILFFLRLKFREISYVKNSRLFSLWLAHIPITIFVSGRTFVKM